MNTTQIRQVLSSDRPTPFKGVFPCDSLPVEIEFPCAIVANTDARGLGGEHWVCYYFDEQGNAEYFDSYGIKPVNCDLFGFWTRNGKNHKWNTVQLQGMQSKVCGHWCIAFLSSRARGITMSEFVKKYDGQPGEHDHWVGQNVNNFFDVHKIKTVRQRGGGKFWYIREQKCCSRIKCKRLLK
jgi:hypothetical protein